MHCCTLVACIYVGDYWQFLILISHLTDGQPVGLVTPGLPTVVPPAECQPLGCQYYQCCTDCWALVQRTRWAVDSEGKCFQVVIPPNSMLISQANFNKAGMIGRGRIKEVFTLLSRF